MTSSPRFGTAWWARHRKSWARSSSVISVKCFTRMASGLAAAKTFLMVTSLPAASIPWRMTGHLRTPPRTGDPGVPGAPRSTTRVGAWHSPQRRRRCRRDRRRQAETASNHRRHGRTAWELLGGDVRATAHDTLRDVTAAAPPGERASRSRVRSRSLVSVGSCAVRSGDGRSQAPSSRHRRRVLLASAGAALIVIGLVLAPASCSPGPCHRVELPAGRPPTVGIVRGRVLGPA